LQLGTTLVVALVETLERTTVDKKRHEAGLVGSYRRKRVHPKVKTGNQGWVDGLWLDLLLIDDFDDVMRRLGHDPHLGDGLIGMLGGDADVHS